MPQAVTHTYIFIKLCTRIHVYIRRSWPRLERHEVRKCADKQTCPFQKGSTVRLWPSSAVDGAWLAGTYTRVTVRWLCSAQMKRKKKKFHILEENVEFLIRFAFTGLSTFWAHRLNGAGWFREHIDGINRSVVLSDRAKEQRWEGDEQPRRCMKCLHDSERSRCLCSRCVRAARSQICIVRSVSLLQCMLLRGLPAVASSRSLFTNAFLFSSSSWLGIRPALPPSMWQACYRHTARGVKQLAIMYGAVGNFSDPFTSTVVASLLSFPHQCPRMTAKTEQNFSNWLWRKAKISVFMSFDDCSLVVSISLLSPLCKFIWLDMF